MIGNAIGISFSVRRRAFGMQVAYTATGAVTEINPETVTYADGVFTAPYGTTEFTFKDNGDEMGATYDGGTWVIEAVEGVFDETFDDTFN